MATTEPTTSALPSDFEDFEALLAEYEAKVSAKEGEILQGTIIEVTKDEKIRFSLRACTEDPFNWFKDKKINQTINLLKITTTETLDNANSVIARYENDLDNSAYVPEMLTSKFILAIHEDLVGQVLPALSKKEWWNRWGLGPTTVH